MCVCSSPAPPALPAQLLATLLIQYERLQGVQSSGVLIIFWFLCVVCAIIPFRSKILSAMVEVRRKRDTGRSRPVQEVNSVRVKVTAGPRLLPSAPLWCPGLQSFLCCSLLAVSLLGSRTGKGGQAEDQCNSGEWGHWWVFVGVQGCSVASTSC